MKTLKQLTALFLLITSATFAATALAETVTPELPQYDVEIIIFEDAHARYINSEEWRYEEKEENNTQAQEPEQPPENPDNLSLDEIKATAITPLKPAILQSKYKSINASSEYNVLFYGAWRQAGLPKEKAFEVSIDELQNNHTSTSENRISGTLKLVLARYLHIFGNLEYHRPGEVPAENNMPQTEAPAEETQTENTGTTDVMPENAEENTATETTTYPIEFRRRMRSKELHYIDHPLVGILVQVNPVKKVEEKTAN